MAPIDDLQYAEFISASEILLLSFLNIVLEHFFSGLLYIFLLCAAFLLYLCKSWVAHRHFIKRLDSAAAPTCTPSVRQNAYEEHRPTDIVGMPINDTREVKLSIEEVKTMMEALDREHSYNNENNNLGLSAGIEGLFEEELSLEEVKAAFDLFDENGDGFIDAEDLKKVLCAMGFTVASEIDECKKMVSVFDRNGDGRLDFVEFAKLVEQSCS